MTLGADALDAVLYVAKALCQPGGNSASSAVQRLPHKGLTRARCGVSGDRLALLLRVMKQDKIKVNSLVEVVQSTRVLSGWLLSDTDMAGALCLAAGNCWLQQSKNGRCQVLYRTELSKEECCKTGRLGTSWTEEDVPNSTLFKWMIFNGGAPHCIPCKETCENVDCGPGKKCKMNKKNKPRCVCAPDCSNITWKGPVCGLDGKTYKDECALLKAKCKGVPELDVQYQGKCKKTCRDVLCPGTSTCVVDQTNNAYCVTCHRHCPEPTSPEQYLCGNDGITYASACHLRKATCLLGRSIGLAYEGKCIKAKSCEDIKCSVGKKCLWDSRVGRGRCAVCEDYCPDSKSDEAVCASDNTTYPSECAMKQAACSLGLLLEVKHTGSCNSINEDPDDEEEEEDPDYSFPLSSVHW